MHSSVSTRNPRRAARTTIRLVVLLSIVLTIVFVVSFVFSEEGIAELQRAQKRVSDLDREVERLRSENERLRRELETLRSSTYAYEKIAREDLGMAKPGETVYVLPDEPGSSENEE
ncbi:MAG TPA: septum formation initiator family protein [Thermoanaerobaculia bacterium]|nr:septum formation initiator family protein [Thermoanaerobaculia bacterium]